ncbi:S4 RNA-binding domain-containing protein [Citrus sinensis]|uniref:S4 RNA-binding domain-containing protein n=1 Tax=Citrus sinensis TaxID=2711 RepID=A0ACB8NYA8_CITSI|nr:S4 RNA-binding domain-containing protein [Citrus sinensis]
MAAISLAAPWILRRAVRTFSLPQPLLHLNPGIRQLIQAVKGNFDDLLKGVGDKNAIEEVKHILEMARRASSRREVLHSDFLTPPVLKESMMALEKLADVKAVAQGGYPQAERCRLSVGHPEALTSDPDIVAALRQRNFGFQPCSHGDFLGSILGTGIAREKIGDIILQGEKGAQFLVVPELADYLITSLEKLVKHMHDLKFYFVDSNGDVRVNWTTVTKNGTTLRTGDIVSVSGKGRIKVSLDFNEPLP